MRLEIDTKNPITIIPLIMLVVLPIYGYEFIYKDMAETYITINAEMENKSCRELETSLILNQYSWIYLGKAETLYKKCVSQEQEKNLPVIKWDIAIPEKNSNPTIPEENSKIDWSSGSDCLKWIDETKGEGNVRYYSCEEWAEK